MRAVPGDARRSGPGGAPEAGGPERDAGEAVVGLVLCGGRSTRMGRDKAGIRIGERTLLERAVEAVAPVADPVLLAVGPARRPDRLAPQGLDQVLDARPGAGPLAGIEAGLTAAAERCGDAWVATLACDLPGATPAAFAVLLRAARASDADGAWITTERGPEPLFAVLHTRLLPAVRAALDADERRVVALLGHPLPARDGALPSIVSVPLELHGAALGDDAARNLNTPADVEREVRRRPAAVTAGEVPR